MIGLAILVNTCSPLTHSLYSQFHGHASAVANYDKNQIPVCNRYV